MKRNFGKELKFFSTRSSGKGGQHVNKVSTRVELVFNVPASEILTEEEKRIVSEKLANKISSEGDLRVASEAHRSNLLNKKECIKKFTALLEKALRKPKVRKPTKPSKYSLKKKKEEKKKLSEKKQSRREKKLRDF